MGEEWLVIPEFDKRAENHAKRDKPLKRIYQR